ncbi:MAG: HesA/MoeB/ThiF family protein [Bacteroidales bacterium]|jgi:molybdopterin/thiamine biosynthesis adenylyltransferase|nr:HesA/MoeB/ThiF family protein [Bacteroidales bacterium]
MNKSRYDRNILIEGFGREGQQKLQNSKVLVIGAGGLGSPVLYYLAAAGVGTLGIIDSDVVDISNLQRQILHHSTEIGMPKIISAKEKLEALNPDVHIVTYKERFTQNNAAVLVRQYDFIVDCCDNYETKFLINDICVAEQKPYSHGAVLAMRGEVMTYIPGSAHYRKIFGGPPAEKTLPTSAQAGILGAVAGIVGSIQATETIKYLVGIGDLIINRILIIDGNTMAFHILKL